MLAGVQSGTESPEKVAELLGAAAPNPAENRTAASAAQEPNEEP